MCIYFLVHVLERKVSTKRGWRFGAVRRQGASGPSEVLIIEPAAASNRHAASIRISSRHFGLGCDRYGERNHVEAFTDRHAIWWHSRIVESIPGPAQGSDADYGTEVCQFESFCLFDLTNGCFLSGKKDCTHTYPIYRL